MKRLKTIGFAGLILLLTACHETYDHVSDAHDGMSGGNIMLFVILMLFCFAFAAGGVPLLVFGIRSLRRKPERRGGPITRVTFGSILITIGVVSMILTTCAFFDNEFTMPESRKYKTVAKVLERATDESVTHFRCSKKGYNRNEYLHDEGLEIKEALSELTYKSISQKNENAEHGAYLMYYVDLEPQNGYVYPFAEIRVYEDGYSYIDYVREYSHQTVTFFYQIDGNSAKTIITLAEKKNDAIRERAYQDQREAYERGKIENFFEEVSVLTNINASVCFGSDSHYFLFRKEGLDIIKDFRYTEVERNQVGTARELFRIRTGSWDFELQGDNESGYAVLLTYEYKGASYTHCYKLRDIDGEEIYNIAKEQYKEQYPNEFDYTSANEAGKINNFFKAKDAFGNFDLATISHNSVKYYFNFDAKKLETYGGYTYTQVEEEALVEQPEIFVLENTINPWTFKLYGDLENNKDYSIKLSFKFKDPYEIEHIIDYYYTVSNEDGYEIYETALSIFKYQRPEIFYAEYEDGKIEHFFENVVTADNDKCTFYYRGEYHNITLKMEDLVTISHLTYTLEPNDTLLTKGHTARINTSSPKWEFILNKYDQDAIYFFVGLRYAFKDADNKLIEIDYTYSISNKDSMTIYNIFVARLAEQHPEIFQEI